MNIKRLVITAVLSFIIYSTPVMAQHGYKGQHSKLFNTDVYEEVEALDTNVETITEGLISTADPKTHRAYIKVTSQGIRWLCTGDSPSTSLGNPASVGDWFQLVGLSDIQNFKFVNDDDEGTAICHINLQVQGVMD